MLKDYFEMQDISVIMTRDIDKGLYSDTSSNKKRADLQNRVNIANESNPNLVISIHQNSYPTPDCKGAQVFYYQGSVEGEKLAEYIQRSLIFNVDQGNKRNIKANNNYFLLKEITATTVIVECGFLSSPEEAELLNMEEYQKKLAYGILAGTMAYLEDDIEIIEDRQRLEDKIKIKEDIKEDINKEDLREKARKKGLEIIEELTEEEIEELEKR